MSDGEKKDEKMEQGPYKTTRVTRLTMAPINIAIEVVSESSHVPSIKAPCGCDEEIDGYTRVIDAITQTVVPAILTRLDAIRDAQRAQATAVDPSSYDPDPAKG